MHATTARTIERLRAAAAGPGAVLAAEIALVCAIASVAALLTWRLLPDDRSRPDVSIAAIAPPASGQGDTGGVDLAALHLFGVADPQASARQSEEAPADAPETRLNLRLQGVFATGAGNGIAIIAVGNTRESVFTVGDRVAGQARVDGIYSDRVILERDGALETLRLSTDEIGTRPAVSAAERDARGNRDVQRIAGRARQLRAQLMENPLQLARMVRFQPYLRDGELIGYRIQPRGAEAQLLTELGLQPTDVITSINGIELTDPAKAQQVLRQMQTATTISVSWLRNGERREMTIPIGSPS